MSGTDQVVGVRFSPGGAVEWFRAGDFQARPGDWVVASKTGEVVGQVVVGIGQCLSFAGEVGALPKLSRAARPDEIPVPAEGAGRTLLSELRLDGAPPEKAGRPV